MTDANDRVTRALAQLGAEHIPPPGWEARVLAAIAPRPVRRRWWLALPLVAMIAGAVLWWPAPRPDPLTLVVDRGPSAMRLEKGPPAGGRIVVALGDPVTATARGGERHHAIWVYRDGLDLVARCPGDAACRREGGGLTLALTMDRIGLYQVVAWSSAAPLPAAGRGYSADVAAAIRSGASSVIRELDVQ